MMKRLWSKVVSLVLVVALMITAVPAVVFAEETEGGELYIKAIQLARADSQAEAKVILEAEGYTLLNGNLNEGTGEDGIWLGYQTTTDPTEAIYDLKLMNMNGGFTLTSMEEAMETQEALFAEMANDLNYLIKEFTAAYDEESVPAQVAYKALNFFRMVPGETELLEENGLGYHIVNGKLSIEELTEIVLLCDSNLVDSIIKILTTGIQIYNGNWMKELSELGPYDSETTYFDDSTEDEFKRRAEQLLPVLQLYSQAYNAMDLSGLIPDKLDDNFEPQNNGDKPSDPISADDAAVKKLDESRYKLYKVIFDELAKYPFETNQTLKDFFCSLENEGSTKDIYPLVAVLSDGEFAALSYGCFLEVAAGAFAELSDFDSYDELYDSVTQDAQSVYLYYGVDDVFFNADAVIGFTEAATRHMASTGELEFYEKESAAEDIWETGKNVATIVGCTGLAIVGVAKITAGISMGIAAIAAATGAAKSALLAGIIKVSTAVGGPLAMLAAFDLAVRVAVISFIMSVITEEINGKIDWDENPMPNYLYDVKEVDFSQASVNGGITTEYVKKPVFSFYKAVTDSDGKVIDLNARSKEASQWIAMYVSYDRQGDNAKPIKAEDLLVKTGNGETPEGYVPLTRFGEVIACNLNQWDDEDDVNGVYVFYKQDSSVSVDDGKTYYIYDVYLQVGESDSHCIELLKAAGYTPLNVNLSPDLYDDDILFKDKQYTYLGYKTTTNKNSAIRDLRVIYGPAQGQIQLGAATYADCGSNGQVTLYATKYATAGTPLLAGGLICVDEFSKAPAGYEPICLMGGGPAVSINITREGKVHSTNAQTYLYFLPETTFTGGTQYLADVTLLYIVQNAIGGINNGIKPTFAPQDLRNYFSYYTSLGGGSYEDSLVCYSTYNPYRAIYDVKAVVKKNLTSTFVFEGTGYVELNQVSCTYLAGSYQPSVSNNPINTQKVENFYLQYADSAPAFSGNALSGALYLSGNPESGNEHVKGSNSMSGVQPLKVSDIMCVTPYKDPSYAYVAPTIPSNYTAVSHAFSDSTDPAVITFEKANREYKFYIAKSTKQLPYISNIYAMDSMSIFRSYGGYEAGITESSISEMMVLTQLSNQGATNFCSKTISIYHSDDISSSSRISLMKFAYKRTAKAEDALRDVFLYYNGFSTDKPPKELYRGNVKYTVICEIPYNYSVSDDAPKPGIYLYGTTNQKAGNPITSLEISDIPFMDGYRTVRTNNGRSIWSEIQDDVTSRRDAHPMQTGKNIYQNLYNFFTYFKVDKPGKNVHPYFYLHIQKEGDNLRQEKPYVGEVYLTGCPLLGATKPYEAMEDLFDKGAEAYVSLDLNQGASDTYSIYLGYSYTGDPSDAIRDIRAYHEKNPPKKLTDDDGVTYTLVQDLDLNKDAGGDYIYLYTTKDGYDNSPITELSGGYSVVEGTDTITWVDGTQKIADTSCVKRWDTDSYSDLNRRAGGKYIYLMFTGVRTVYQGTYSEPVYGADPVYSRDPFENQNPDGKYIGGLYVMDKNTILQEKIAAGTLATGSKCDKISDDEVKERLAAMGATTIIEAPFMVTGAGYFKNNTNKVYIGYSHTKSSKKAIRGIAIKCEVLSLKEPAEQITVDGNNYYLVAEAASEVATLPRAVNLIGVDNGQDLLVPRMYLYYSTTADNDPIYDITIDSTPIKNGWLTAMSANETDAFIDISEQADTFKEIADADNAEYGFGETNYHDVYSTSLYNWSRDLSELFNPNTTDLTPYYIHTKHYTDVSPEELKPYISEVFVAEGDSEYAALANLVQYGVEGYVECDLNLKAGGKYVYLGYKRTEKAKNALTDLVIFEGKDPAPSKRIDVNGNSVKYTLVNNVDLNSKAGGKWLYLYASNSDDTGNPITNLQVNIGTASSFALCGVETATVKRAEGKVITDEHIDLNKSAGGETLYLIMTRETTEGHAYSFPERTEEVAPTCGEDGYLKGYFVCRYCHEPRESIMMVHPATGEHTDEEGDGDHRCDVCRAKNVSAHVHGEVQREDEEEATCVAEGSYYAVIYCVECEEELRSAYFTLEIDPNNHKDGKDKDHNCDLCGALNVEDHTPAKPVEERVEATDNTVAYSKMVTYCKECGAKLNEETVGLPALNTQTGGKLLIASVFASGSSIALIGLSVFAILVAIFVFLQKKKKDAKGENGDA